MNYPYTKGVTVKKFLTVQENSKVVVCSKVELGTKKTSVVLYGAKNE